MKLDYNILWIEDDHDFFESIRGRVQRHIEDLGFTLKLEHKEGESDDLLQFIEEHDFDLILLDYNLSQESKNGYELIQLIRDHELLTEIIFYSDYVNFLEESGSDLIEGVYYSRSRNELPPKMEKVIDLTLKKSQDLNNIRGLFIAETIDLESKLDSILTSYFGTDEEKNAVFKKIIAPGYNSLTIKNKFDIMAKLCKSRKQAIDSRIKSSRDEDEQKEWEGKLRELDQIQSTFKQFNEEIIEIRNILSHIKENPSEKNTITSNISKNKRKIVIDHNECRNIRKNIKKHSENIDRIQEMIHFNC